MRILTDERTRYWAQWENASRSRERLRGKVDRALSRGRRAIHLGAQNEVLNTTRAMLNFLFQPDPSRRQVRKTQALLRVGGHREGPRAARVGARRGSSPALRALPFRVMGLGVRRRDWVGITARWPAAPARRARRRRQPSTPPCLRYSIRNGPLDHLTPVLG